MFVYMIQIDPFRVIPDETVYEISAALNPYHIVNTCLILEVLATICW